MNKFFSRSIVMFIIMLALTVNAYADQIIGKVDKERLNNGKVILLIENDKHIVILDFDNARDPKDLENRTLQLVNNKKEVVVFGTIYDLKDWKKTSTGKTWQVIAAETVLEHNPPKKIPPKVVSRKKSPTPQKVIANNPCMGKWKVNLPKTLNANKGISEDDKKGLIFLSTFTIVLDNQGYALLEMFGDEREPYTYKNNKCIHKKYIFNVESKNKMIMGFVGEKDKKVYLERK